jgi:transposase
LALLQTLVPDLFWEELRPLLPVKPRRFRHPGRRPYDDRDVLEGILFVLPGGIPWRALPQEPGKTSGKTCWRRLAQWQQAGVWEQLVGRLQGRLAEAELLEWRRSIADATIVAAKRGAP